MIKDPVSFNLRLPTTGDSLAEAETQIAGEAEVLTRGEVLTTGEVEAEEVEAEEKISREKNNDFQRSL